MGRLRCSHSFRLGPAVSSVLCSGFWPCSGQGCPECVGLDPRRGLVRETTPTRLDTRQAECKAWGRVLLGVENV